MTPEQKKLIVESFQSLLPCADEAAARFYERLFALDPVLRPLFLGDMRKQRKKLMDTLEVAILSLDRLDTLVPVLWQLGKRHGGYGVQDSHYDTVGAALLWALEEQLGQGFTPAHKEAWTEVYGLIAATMKQAAAEGAIARPQLAWLHE